jgi:LysM repeat protein
VESQSNRIVVDSPITIKNSVRGASRVSTGFIEAKHVDGTDSDLSVGYDDGRYAPDSIDSEFNEFNDIAPIEPIKPIASRSSLAPAAQTVAVSGSSFETYTVKKGDNLWSLAKRYNVSLNELYTANNLNKSSVLSIGQQLRIPVEGGTATVKSVSADTYQPSSYNQASTEYTVKRGDSLSKIASQFGTSVRAIKASNGKSTDMIRVGEKLVIPVSGSAAGAATSPVVTPVPTVTRSSSASSSYTMPSASSITTSGSSARTHTVKAGEYPATIARQYGMTTGELLALNGITDPRKLQVGQVLKVSASGSAENVASRMETVVAPAAAQVSSAAATTRSNATNLIPAVSTSSSSSSSNGPVEIKVIEADPLVEGEAAEIQVDEMFDGAVEIPVIRLEGE